MAKKYTKIPVDTFKNIQLNAGILADSFTPSTGEIGNLLGATTGGCNFKATPTYTDFGDDVDNAPKNMMEMKVLESIEATMSGTFISVTADTVKMLLGAADSSAVEGTNVVKVIPRSELANTDFKDVWWIGDYSDVNTGDNAGYIAIHLMHALNTDGFQIQSADKAKGQFAFNFMGHYSMTAQEVVPFEIYMLGGGAVIEPGVLLNKHAINLAEGDTFTLIAATTPVGETVTWSTSDSSVVSVVGGVVTAEGAGNTIITATITVDEATYTDTCTVVVEAAAEG
jgi:hypothetical protein